MMPGITISFLLSEQRSLIFRTVPLEFQLACPKKSFNDAPNRLGIQIRTANFPGRSGDRMFALQ